MVVKAEDAFKSARAEHNRLDLTVGTETIPMLLSYKDVREAARDWKTYSSDAPFRVPIPSEEKERSVRQLPIETDPPQHKKYRSLIEPFFRRPMQAAYIERIDALIGRMLERCAERPLFDVVRDFALPIQSYALSYLLGVLESEADTWIAWGTHVFRDGDDSRNKGTVLEDYLRRAIQDAESLSSDDNFFAALNRMKVDGRPLSEDEMLGIGNLVFAGGRDTVINAIAYVMNYFAKWPNELMKAASDPRSINLAVEEFIRTLSPLTHIGRVCPSGHGTDNRVSLCWAAANFDPAIFEAPELVDLTRSPNPHVGFGSGHHACLGAPQARAILRSLIAALSAGSLELRIEEEVLNIEHYGAVQRTVGFDRLIAVLGD
ncbi:MAG: cytochrome P450 [Pseudomonadota bacterium]